MGEPTTREAVLHIAEEVLEVEAARLTDGAHLTGDLGATSLQLLDFVVAVERHFRVRFTAEELKAERLGQVMQAVEAAVARR